MTAVVLIFEARMPQGTLRVGLDMLADYLKE